MMATIAIIGTEYVTPSATHRNIVAGDIITYDDVYGVTVIGNVTACSYDEPILFERYHKRKFDEPPIIPQPIDYSFISKSDKLPKPNLSAKIKCQRLNYFMSALAVRNPG